MVTISVFDITYIALLSGFFGAFFYALSESVWFFVYRMARLLHRRFFPMHYYARLERRIERSQRFQAARHAPGVPHV